MPKRFWWPTSMPAQLVLIQNFLAKIGGYQTALGLNTLQVTTVTALCDAYIGAFNAADQAKTTMQAMTQWRDSVFYGEPEGTAAGDPPVFPVVGTTTYQRGTVNQFMAFRDYIVALPGYTVSIGEDLGIVGPEVSPIAPDLVSPAIKSVKTNGYTVSISGSMQGFDAMRVEYAPKGGNFAPVAFLTNTPGGFSITPAVANQPETGHIRAIYIKKNAEYGNYSADYPVTLA